MLQSPNVQDVFWPIPGLISSAGVTGSVAITLEHWSREYSEVGSNPTWGISLERREIEPSQVALCCLVLDESQRCDHVHEHIVSSMPVCILRFSINTISICGTVLQLHVHV